MKITINKGETVENVLSYLKEFFEQNCELLSNMSIYCNLENDVNKCPENSREYLLSEEGAVDGIEAEQKNEFLSRKQAWYKYVKRQDAVVKETERAIKTDQNYLDTAEEKKRKPENIEKRKIAMAKKQKKLEEDKEWADFVHYLDDIRSTIRVQTSICGNRRELKSCVV